MSHHAPSSSQAAIFSPSVARAAASTAKDWSYIDTWLREKYAASGVNNHRGRGNPPAFERNPDTLRALLALAAANEAADEDRERLARVEEAALAGVRDAEREREEARRLQQQQQQQQQQHEGATTTVPNGSLLATDLLTALESGLTREAQTALAALSETALTLGVADPSPDPVSSLGARFAALQARALELEDAAERANLLRRYLDREAARLDAFLADLRRGDAGPYRLAPDLAKQNLERQRRVKAVAGTQLPELRRQVVALEKATGGIPPGPTVEDVRRDEEAYLELLAAKKDLDAQVRAFAGLPPDVEAARAELEALRAELRDATERRDANFERLVERESPVKSRKRP
ncbi:hypothetical protein F4820DRAFT_470457 [Hypoxylon rubiginosum]|uniref:Uncharacterized protein n=1 Tax=Hypoxylon rubiginosum TaxID=110542 RepID=A0ACB9YZP8_9PEZI|nr:hypothetical protein F4820DRAFT_470457 [Hypoxylon rubiginosum]